MGLTTFTAVYVSAGHTRTTMQKKSRSQTLETRKEMSDGSVLVNLAVTVEKSTSIFRSFNFYFWK
jgi:hypothetical protein